MTDLELVVRDKYDGDALRVTDEDRERLSCGEPLAYIIGWQPFLGLHIHLDSKPLIPRPETEWWTELAIQRIRDTMIYHSVSDAPLRVLDLCAGSGAVGLAVAHHLPECEVTFAEIETAHLETIRANAAINRIDLSRIHIYKSDLFGGLPANETYDFILTNPPYIPSGRTLDESVVDFEPHQALFAGNDGLLYIERILREARARLATAGELWLECDSTHPKHVYGLSKLAGFENVSLLTDPYGRERVLVAY